jgi:hypothetical protein
MKILTWIIGGGVALIGLVWVNLNAAPSNRGLGAAGHFEANEPASVLDNLPPGVTTNLPPGASTNLPPGVSNTPHL